MTETLPNGAERTWTNIAARYSTPARRPDVVAEIDRLEWLPIEDRMDLPMSPGLAIRKMLEELRPKGCTHIAWMAHDGGDRRRPAGFDWPGATPDQEGEYPSLFGIEKWYANGRARIYVIDAGVSLLTVASDFWPKEAQAA